MPGPLVSLDNAVAPAFLQRVFLPGPTHPAAFVSKRSVTLTIAGQTLSIRTDADDARLRRIVRKVDGRVDEIRRGAPSIPTAKVHLLAALTLAEELVQCEDARDEALAAAAHAPEPEAIARREAAAARVADGHRQLDLLASRAVRTLDEDLQQLESEPVPHDGTSDS